MYLREGGEVPSIVIMYLPFQSSLALSLHLRFEIQEVRADQLYAKSVRSTNSGYGGQVLPSYPQLPMLRPMVKEQ